jgi:glycosyltransferase involved in cell wall biosynthesis
MRIAIDAIGIERPGGGRFTALNLIQGILQEDRGNEYLIIVSSEEPSLRQFPNATQRIIPEQNRFAARVKAQALIPFLLREEKIDIIHFAKNLGVFLVPCKTLVTIYDMTILNYPGFFPTLDVIYWHTVQRFFFRFADKISVLSESTKRDVMRHYGLPVEKIDVIYSACDPIFRPLEPEVVEETRMRYGLPPQYILSVGNISPKKNFSTLVKALGLLKQEYRLPHKLVIAGGEYWSEGALPLRELISSLGLHDDVMLVGTVVGQDLVALYNGATLFAFPSLDEGFGIVLLEAMASGTPVIASKASAIPEVVGEAGILLKDPQDHSELAKTMARVITDSGLRASLIQQGLQRAGQFSWRKAGRAYVRAYEQLMVDN